jgi:hypothetical protein
MEENWRGENTHHGELYFYINFYSSFWRKVSARPGAI